MGSSIKGGGTTTVKQSNEPPKWAAPLFSQSAGEAQRLYNSGTGFNIWPGSTTAEPSEMTTLGSQGLANVAKSPDSMLLAQNPVQLANQAISQGGLMAPSQESMSFFGNMAGGGLNPSANWFNALRSGTNAQTDGAGRFFSDVTGGGLNPSTSGLDALQRGTNAHTNGAAGFFGNMAGGGLNPSTQAFDALMSRANNQSTGQARDIYRMFGDGQYNTDTGADYQALGQQAMGQQPGDNGISQFGRGLNNVTTGRQFGQIYRNAREPGAAEDYLTSTARGDYLAEGNPYYRQILEKEAERLGDQVSGVFAGSGRYGSGAHQGVLGDTVGDFMQKGLSEDFTRERGLQMDAAQSIEAAQQGRMDRQQSAVEGMTGVQDTNRTRQLSALLSARGFAGEDLDRAMRAIQGVQGADAMNAGMALSGAEGLAGVGRDVFGNLLAGTQARFNAQQQNLENRSSGASSLADIGQLIFGNRLAGTQAGFDARQQNLQNRMQGADDMASLGQMLFGNRLAGTQAQFGAQQQNLQNQVGGAQSAADISNQGLMQALGFINAMPTIQQNRTFAPQLMMQSGAVQDQFNQSQINDMISRFYQQDMQPWTRLGALQSAATGSAGEYGTMQRMTNEPGPGLLGLLGNAVSAFM